MITFSGYQSCDAGQSLLLRGWTTWDSFAHKKAMLIGGFLLAWNTSSYSSRLWGGKLLGLVFNTFIPWTTVRSPCLSLLSSQAQPAGSCLINDLYMWIVRTVSESLLRNCSYMLWPGAGFILVVWLKLYQQSHPASFEKALADASGSSAIDRIDRRKNLQQTTMASRVWCSWVC